MFMGGDDLQSWARDAAPGASLCLGVGAAMPAATAAAVRSLSEAGIIDAPRRRIGPERYSFVVQRRSARYIERQAPVPRRAGGRGGHHARRAGTAERRVLKLLLAAVAKGLPCPTNAAIAKATGLPDENAASYRIKLLQRRGLIRVAVPNDPRLPRVVTIVASGKSTKPGA
jgi:hypothetical protein